MTRSADLLHVLRDVLGEQHVLTEREVVAAYDTDWTRRWHGRAAAVVRPASTADVAACVRACGAAGVAVVPQGGNTGLVGGSVAHGGEVVLSTRRLDGLDPVETTAAQVTVGAGATLEAVQAHVRGSDLDVGVDLAARGSATIGGMVATNAGGVHVVRHGSMRARVAGVEAVLADGSVVERLGGLGKDNTGYDLAGLFCGSEGTLGVVTRVRLQLVPVPRATTVALVGVAGTSAALDLLDRLRRLPALQAAEWFHHDGLELVCTHAGLRHPFSRVHPTYLLLECAADADPTEDLATVIGDLDAAVATDAASRAQLWAYRERHTEAINALGVPHKLDVTLPLERLATFEDDVRRALGAWTVVLFGHLGDGNVHVNVVGPDPEDESVDDLVLRLVARAGGSISAEHGIGVAKRRWVPLTRSPADVAAMLAIKRALDPDGILNPNVLFPA